MNLISIQRDVFTALGGDSRESYIRGVVTRETDDYNEEIQGMGIDYINQDDVTNIVRGITSLIVKNEGLIQRYSWEDYMEENYPAYEHCSGFYYSTGRYAVCFFDISAEKIEDLDYSFTILKVL